MEIRHAEDPDAETIARLFLGAAGARVVSADGIRKAERPRARGVSEVRLRRTSAPKVWFPSMQSGMLTLAGAWDFHREGGNR